MRLIQAIAASNRHATGMTTVFAELMNRAQELGWSFEFMIPRAIEGAEWTESFLERGAVIHVLDEGGIRELAAQISAALDTSSEPALMHTHLSTYDVPAVLAARRRSDVGLVWHVHSVLPEGLKPLLRSRVKFNTFGRRVDRVVIPFENTRGELIKRGVPPEHLVVMPGCIDADEYPLRSAEERRRAREAMEVPDSSHLLLHFGWHWHEKGGDLFLETVRLLIEAGVPVTALINRGGEAATASAERLGLTDVVQIGGLVEDSRSLYVAADCMVGPSRAEGLTFSYIEALATGVPVVATNLPGKRFLYDSVRACMVASHDPESLAGAVRSVLERTDEEAQSSAEEAHAWIATERSVERVTADLLDEYRLVMDERGTRT